MILTDIQGTVLNIVLISIGLYCSLLAGAIGDLNVTLLQLFIFGSLIAAVDPVAVS